jgi:hypothetical protein
MEVDLVVTLKPRPIESKVTFSIGIFSNIAHGASETKGVATTEGTIHSHGKVDHTLSDTIAKDE